MVTLRPSGHLEEISVGCPILPRFLRLGGDFDFASRLREDTTQHPRPVSAKDAATRTGHHLPAFDIEPGRSRKRKSAKARAERSWGTRDAAYCLLLTKLGEINPESERKLFA